MARVGAAIPALLLQRRLLWPRRLRFEVRHRRALRQVFARQHKLGLQRALVDALEHAEVGARERAAFPSAQERDALATVTILRSEGFAAFTFLRLLSLPRFLRLLLSLLVGLLVCFLVCRALRLFSLALSLALRLALGFASRLHDFAPACQLGDGCLAVFGGDLTGGLTIQIKALAQMHQRLDVGRAGGVTV